jgi:hypothetical protein
MIDRRYCVVMDSYNRWMNERLYACCAEVPEEERRRDLGSTDLPFSPGADPTRGVGA